MATGDTIAQQAIEKKGARHDFSRTGRMASYGACEYPHPLLFNTQEAKRGNPPKVIFGPAAANWFRFLSRYVVLQNKKAEVVARVVLDQTLFSPTALGVFLVTMGYLDGHHDPKAHVREHYWNLLQKNWMLWPGVQVINFGFVPLAHRLTFSNTVAIGWNCYLSYVNSHKSPEEAAVASDEAKVHLE